MVFNRKDGGSLFAEPLVNRAAPGADLFAKGRLVPAPQRPSTAFISANPIKLLSIAPSGRGDYREVECIMGWYVFSVVSVVGRSASQCAGAASAITSAARGTATPVRDCARFYDLVAPPQWYRQ